MKSELIKSYIFRHIKTAVVVSVIAGILSYFLIIIFPGMDIIDAGTVSSSWPQIMKDLFGDPLYAFTDIYAWIQLQLFHITLWVYFGIFAALLASDIVGKEIDDKSIDILLSTPVTRAGLILSRLTGVIIMLIMSVIPAIIACMFGINAMQYPLKPDILLTAFLSLLLLSFVFAAITTVLSIYIHKQSYAILVTFGIFGGMFLYEELLVKMIPIIDNIKYIIPLHYYKPQHILIYDSFTILDPIMLLIFFIAFAMIAVVLFSKKDIKL